MPNSDVMIPVEGGSMGAYCAEPQDPNGGGIVILQEIFGVNANLRAVADTFAGQGYVVVVPDLFWRQERDVQLDPNDKAAHEKATTLMKRLDQPQALRDAQRALDWLRARPDVGGGIGVMGYGLGGKLAYQLAGGPGIAAIAVYYGTGLHTVLGPLDGFAGKMLLHVAEADHLCPPAAQAAIREAHGR
ncbi:MAG: dienelactone hydrolase family protein, partial [Pararhodobacter sp.]|nr:dienelactone hydrolase family protein [Pararhodobacter sp.]